jgi:hypothetical protein
MNIGENILHGADLPQVFYSGFSKSNVKPFSYTLKSMVFLRNNYLLLHSIWLQIRQDLMMNIGGEILHGANLLQYFSLRSHLPTISPTKLPSILNMKPISKIASETLGGLSLEDYLSQPHILEPYFSSEIAEVGSLPSTICEPDLFWKEALNTHSSMHQVRKDCSCYHACRACLMSDVVNIPPLTSSFRYLDISSEITKFDPLLSLIGEQLSKNPPMSAIARLSVFFPDKIIITSRITYYPQVLLNGHYSLWISFPILFSNTRQTQDCIWNGSVVPKQYFTTSFPGYSDPSVEYDPGLISIPERVLGPSTRPTSWLITYVTAATNYSASIRDVALDQQTMFSSGCGIHLNSPELLLALSTYWHQQPVCCEFESYSLHVFVTRIHKDSAPQIKSLSTSVACIPYPPDAALYSHGFTSYDFQRHLSRCRQPPSSSLSLSAAPLCLPPTVFPLIPSNPYMQSPVKSSGTCIPLTSDTVSLPYWQTTLNLLSTPSAHGLVTPVAPAYSTP